jgi:hypothetical protein
MFNQYFAPDGDEDKSAHKSCFILKKVPGPVTDKNTEIG